MAIDRAHTPARRRVTLGRPTGSRLRALGAALLVAPLAGCDIQPPEWTEATVAEPTIFAPGVLSSEERDYAIAFTPDGREAYFTRRSRRGPSRIVSSTWDGERWTDPEPATFSVEGDETPFMAPDGSHMVFVSQRPMTGSRDRSENLWATHRTVDGWSVPEPLPGALNRPWSEVDDFTRGSERGPALLGDGTLLYWTRENPEWGSDLYVAEPDAEGRYDGGRPLRINSAGDETNAVLSPDGHHLVFQAYRGPEGLGDQDLYVSARTEYGWADPTPLPPPINSPDSDAYPRFSPDGRFLFFASDRGQRGGYYDIYYVEVSALDLRNVGTAP